MNTLTLVFNKDLNKVLMCYDKECSKYNFISGKVDYIESEIEASYRELLAKTGIKENIIDLKFIELESTAFSNRILGTHSLYVTAGVLKEDVELKEESNQLIWVDVDDIEFLMNAYGQGSCYTYLRRALFTLTGDLKYF